MPAYMNRIIEGAMEWWGMVYNDIDDLTFTDSDPELPGEEAEDEQADENGNIEFDDDQAAEDAERAVRDGGYE